MTASVTIDGVTRKLTATKERLQNMLSTTGSAIFKEVQNPGEGLTYKGEHLKVPRGYFDKESVITAVTTLMKKLISEAISVLEVRFSSFQSNPVLSATSVLSPSTWPSDSSVLVRFGYDQIRQLSTFFTRTTAKRLHT